jgi:flagellar protein FlaG
MRAEGVNAVTTSLTKMPAAGEARTVRAREEHSPVNQEPQKTEQQLAREKVSEAEVIAAIEKANEKLQYYDTRIEFSIHEKTRQILIKVYKNDEVIREIPSEKILDMVAKMIELAGLFVDEKV